MLSNQNAALGNCVISTQTGMTTSPQNFVTQQSQLDLIRVVATSLIPSVGLGIKLSVSSLNAKKTYSYPDFPGDFIITNIQWNSTQVQTAADLKDAIDAAMLAYELSDGSNMGDYVTVTNPGGGVLLIGTDTNYGINIQYSGIAGVTVTNTLQPIDLPTYEGEAILVGTVGSDDPNAPTAMRYSENPVTTVSPTASSGLYVGPEQPFDIVGRENIVRAQFIQDANGSDGTIDYQIYI